MYIRYEEEHSNRCHWPERHISNREPERHTSGNRELDNERWSEEWSDDRRHRRRRDTDRDRWCCPDWDQTEQGLLHLFSIYIVSHIALHLDKPPPNRYGSGRWSNPDTTTKWRERDRKHDERYYSRDSQDSPWEDDHEDHTSHYLTAKRNWKRPSSASEMDRKTGEIKARPGQFYLGTGNSKFPCKNLHCTIVLFQVEVMVKGTGGTKRVVDPKAAILNFQNHRIIATN